MAHDDFDNVWDEHQWERHIDEIEKRAEMLRKFIESGSADKEVPRWLKLLRDNNSEFDAVDAFIEEELSMEDAYYPDEEDDEWEDLDEDDMDEDFLYLDEIDFLNALDDEMDEPFFDFEDEEDDEFDDGEEWKSLTDDFATDDYGSIERLDIYREAHALSVDLLQWAKFIPPKEQTKTFSQFINNVLQIGAKLAAAYSFGFEQDTLGGNIAYCKKALHFANTSLHQLQQLKRKAYFNQDTYFHTHGRLFELRNDIGIYIQDLRERFEMGL